MSKAASAPRLPKDNEVREVIRTELGKNLLVEAAAGTGKTASMVTRMVALIRTGACESVATMAAVTFTRKAASELRARFQAELEAAVRTAADDEASTTEVALEALARLEGALANIDQCFIGTIHSFCGRLLRERPVEAGVDLAFEEIESEEDRLLRLEAWDEYSARLIADDPEGIMPALQELGLTITDLADAFVTFADFPDVDEWPVPPPDRTLPALGEVEATIKAYVKRMRASEPLPDDPPPPSGNARRLVHEYRRLPWLVQRSDLDELPALIDVLQQFDRDAPSMSNEVKKAGWADFAKEEQAEWKSVRAVVHPVLEAVMEIRYRESMKALAGARSVYDEMRARRGKLNFQDLLMKAAGLLRDKPQVRVYFSERFTHLLVDEFQDTDPVQAQVMLFLTAEDHSQTDWRSCKPRLGSLFVVGDPKQSIYRFRRADIVTYNDVKEIIGANGRVVELSANFRAVEELIDWTNAAFAAQFPEAATDQSPAYVALDPGREEPPPTPLSGLKVIEVDPELCKGNEGVRGFEDDADAISRAIKGALDSGVELTRPGEEAPAPVKPGDFMIIAYNKKRLSTYARALQRLGIPHQVTGGTALSEVRELSLLRTCLNAVVQQDNPVALVAALRSELFGVSDADLYAFKAAGGRFNYQVPLPEALGVGAAGSIGDAFARLTRYSLWLQKMPPVAAIERICADLGVMVLAASREGGSVQAGSVAKALEMLRGAQDTLPTLGALVDMLDDILTAAGRDESFDGISAVPEKGTSVQVLNLHKAKGLQAPVVFLAGPKSTMNPTIRHHVDRSGDVVRGYMGIFRETNFSPQQLAHPEDWDAKQEAEKAFQEAEATRLRYVAVTRAESMLVVTRQPVARATSIWSTLSPYLAGCPALERPDVTAAPVGPLARVTAEDVRAAEAGITDRIDISCGPTFAVRAAKEYALSGEYAPAGEEVEGGPVTRAGGSLVSFAGLDGSETVLVPEGEHGVEWGGAVHQVLELAMKNAGADLESFAGAALEEAGIDPARLGDLVDTVKSVMTSDVWRRARAARQCLVEVPFVVVLQGDDSLPTLVRGSIDLAFLADDGWAVVDYKTDAVPPDGDFAPIAARYAPQVKLYARAFEACTGQEVRETALYFVRANSLVRI
jgi:ATP-dependent helicase/nuclease subunit A